MAVTDVQRGDSAIALRSCAHSPGRKVYCRLKLTISHDPGRIEREIRLWLRDCETEYVLDFRTCLDLSAVAITQGRNCISSFCGKCGTELFRHSLIRRPSATYGEQGSSAVQLPHQVPQLPSTWPLPARLALMGVAGGPLASCFGGKPQADRRLFFSRVHPFGFRNTK